MATFLIWATAILWLALTTLTSTHETPICNNNPYGQPRFEDCSYLLNRFADSHDGQLRIFDEEQLRSAVGGSWPGIRNPFPAKVVQIPKFWSKCECEHGHIKWDRAYLSSKLTK